MSEFQLIFLISRSRWTKDNTTIQVGHGFWDVVFDFVWSLLILELGSIKQQLKIKKGGGL
jgi:hypothetical protein